MTRHRLEQRSQGRRAGAAGRALGRLDRRGRHRGDAEPGRERARCRQPARRHHRPAEAIEAPASVSRGHAMSAGVGRAGHRQRVDQRHPVGRAGGVPTRRGGHQHRRRRPATCRGSWSRRSGASSPTTVASAAARSTTRAWPRPASSGPRLDGRRGVQEVSDTDAGLLDGDERFDRAVGPMQFIPSTWSVVGVDADNDGQRNPAGHRRRRAGDRGLPLRRSGRPVHRGGPTGVGLPLQPQRDVRRPGAVDHERLPHRRLHRRAQRDGRRRLPHADGALGRRRARRWRRWRRWRRQAR